MDALVQGYVDLMEREGITYKEAVNRFKKGILQARYADACTEGEVMHDLGICKTNIRELTKSLGIRTEIVLQLKSNWQARQERRNMQERVKPVPELD